MTMFLKLGIRAKMLTSLVFILPCVLLMTVLLINYQGISQSRWRLVRQSIAVIGKSDEQMLQLTSMQSHAANFALFHSSTDLAAVREASRRYDQLQHELASLVAADTGQSARLAELKSSVDLWRTTVISPTLERPRTAPTTDLANLPDIMIEPTAIAQFGSLKARVGDFRAIQTGLLNERTAQAEASSALVRRILIGGPVLVIICGVIVLTLIVSRLGKRVSLVAQAAQGISEGKLDHTYQLPYGQDEVGTLASAFSHMADTIRTQIAQQQRSEEDVRENEKIYRLMAENATDMIARLTADGIYLYASPACRKLMGCQPEELVGQSAYAFIHPDDLAVLNASYAPVLDGLDSAPSEYRVRQKDGTYVWVESISRAVYDLETGMMLEIHATTRDITERKRAEADLKASEARFHTAFDQSAIGFALVSLDGRWLEVNRSLCAIVGYSEQEMLTMNFQQLTHPDDIVSSMDQVRQLVMGTLPSSQFEKRYIHREGHIVWVHLSVSIVFGVAQEPLHFITQIQDITERKRSDAEIINLNAKLESHIDVLEQTTREMETLSDLVSALHICDSEQEAYTVINRMIVQLFPHDAGALSILDTTHTLVRTVVVWGGFDGMHTFSKSDCWTLRGSQTYLVDADHPHILCEHFAHDEQISTLCIPMMARGEILGVLHLKQGGGTIGANKQRLAQTVAEDLGLLLSNLRLRETLRLQSIRDPLTGLFNRRYMEESFSRELNRAGRRDQQVGVMMFDIDHFKRFNDQFGHPAGDQLLREFGLCVQRHTRSEDIACRYGGEEFAVIMAGIDLETMIDRAEILRNAIKSLEVQYLSQSLGQVTSSFGVAIYPQDGNDITTLLANADAALYRAKREGRDRVVAASQRVELLDFAVSS